MIDIAEGPGRDLKNIRQIGTPAEGDRIYIENAAYARVHEETYEERRVFIFMGHTECEQGVYMTFVEAAIPVRDMEFSQNLPRWGTHAWSDVFSRTGSYPQRTVRRCTSGSFPYGQYGGGRILLSA